MQAVILAAGKGTRLAPISANRSKPGLPVGGKSLIQRVIEQIHLAGINEFVVVIQPHDTTLATHLAGGLELPIQLSIVTQHEPKGMADALRCAVPYIQGDFLLSAADNLTSTEHVRDLVNKFGEGIGIAGILSLIQVQEEQFKSSGIVELRGSTVTRIIEKPTIDEAPSKIASLPLYIFSRVILGFLPAMKISRRGEYELQDIIQEMIDSGFGVAGLMTEKRQTVTTIADLIQLNLNFLSQDYYQSINRAASQGKNTRLIPPYWVGEGVILGNNCRIGPAVLIENNCRIESGCRIRQSVILEGSQLGPDTCIEHEVVWP